MDAPLHPYPTLPFWADSVSLLCLPCLCQLSSVCVCLSVKETQYNGNKLEFSDPEVVSSRYNQKMSGNVTMFLILISLSFNP